MDRKITAKMMLTYLVVYFIIVVGLLLVNTAPVLCRKSSDSWSLKRFHISPGLLGMHEVRMMDKRLLRLVGDWVIVASSIARLRCWSFSRKSSDQAGFPKCVPDLVVDCSEVLERSGAGHFVEQEPQIVAFSSSGTDRYILPMA